MSALAHATRPTDSPWAAARAWAAVRVAWLAPAVAATVALGIRIYWVRHGILPAYGDQRSLEAFIANVAHGQAYGTHGAYWPPAFIFFAGAVERALGGGHALLAVRSADAVLGALAAAVTADLARRLLGSGRAGLVAGLLFALYTPAIYYTDTVLAVTLGTLLLVAVLDAAVAYGDAPNPWRLGLVGVLLGVATLTKPTELPLLVPACVHWSLPARPEGRARFALRSGAVALALALLVNVPWTWRNVAVTGAPVFVDTNGGINFFIAHNPQATGQYVNLGTHNPVLLRGSGYDRPDTARIALRAGLAYFARHPGADLRQSGHVFHLFWTMRDPDLRTYGQGLYRLLAWWHVPALGFGSLRDLALAGCVLLLSRWRRTAILPLTLLGYAAGLSLLFFAPRFRLPVAPLLAVAAAWALVRLAGLLVGEWRGGGPPAHGTGGEGGSTCLRPPGPGGRPDPARP